MGIYTVLQRGSSCADSAVRVRYAQPRSRLKPKSAKEKLPRRAILGPTHVQTALGRPFAASKRKGLWVGGPVPLGYAAVDKKIVVVPAEAEAVRTIFARYLELGSIRALAAELDRQGI